MLGLALSIATAWIAIALGWARLRRAGVGPSAEADELVASLRRASLDERLPQLLRAARPRTWEASLARDLSEVDAPGARAEVLDASLAELQISFETSSPWERVVPRVAILGGLLGASIAVIRGGVLTALVAASVGAVACGVGAVLVRVARTREARQRTVADQVVQLLAGGSLRASVSSSVSSTSKNGTGLDRRRGRR